MSGVNRPRKWGNACNHGKEEPVTARLTYLLVLALILVAVLAGVGFHEGGY